MTFSKTASILLHSKQLFCSVVIVVLNAKLQETDEIYQNWSS